MNFLTLLTRTKDEPFIEEFVKHYFNEGVDKIHILDDHSTIPFSSYVLNHPNVTIHESLKFKEGDMIEINNLFKKIRLTSTWFILVDADEYITTRKNNNKTIKDELESTFKNVDCIKVPWVFMAWNKREKDPESLLLENTYRMNHDLKHEHPNKWEKGRCRYDIIEVKTIFKGKSFQALKNPHMPHTTKKIICVNSINGNISPLDACYRNLTENKINIGYLICYHYRFTSNECCMRKIKTSNYKVYHTELSNLLATDYPEIIDETVKNKVISRYNYSNSNP